MIMLGAVETLGLAAKDATTAVGAGATALPPAPTVAHPPPGWTNKRQSMRVGDDRSSETHTVVAGLVAAKSAYPLFVEAAWADSAIPAAAAALT